MAIRSRAVAPSRARSVLTGLVAAAAARAAWSVLEANPPGGRARWERTNHAGETITLLEGPGYALGAATALALAPGIPARLRAAGLLATAGAATFGAIDDLTESGTHKGLRGHLGELAAGRVSTGGLKVLGIGATGLAAAALAARGSTGAPTGAPARPRGAAAAGLDLLVSGGVVAGAANLVNLLDLRPGRALKVVLMHSPALAAGAPGPLVAAACGAAVTLLPADLAARSMLGDTGANAAGALLGTAAVAGLGPRGRAITLTGLAALTLASEKVSFTAVIERTPVLRAFDRLGRR